MRPPPTSKQKQRDVVLNDVITLKTGGLVTNNCRQLATFTNLLKAAENGDELEFPDVDMSTLVHWESKPGTFLFVVVQPPFFVELRLGAFNAVRKKIPMVRVLAQSSKKQKYQDNGGKLLLWVRAWDLDPISAKNGSPF